MCLLCGLTLLQAGLAAAAGRASEAQPPASKPADGAILETTRCRLHDTPYDAWLADWEAMREQTLAAMDRELAEQPSPTESDRREHENARRELLGRSAMPRESYDDTFRGGRYECHRLIYASDGLRVVAYLFRPATVSPEARRPVVIFNRGGNREFGKLEERSMAGFRRFLDAGYIVLGSQYRGNDGGEGKEEFGGADVRDVLNLVPLLEHLPDADANNVFLYGASRGGMMAYLALRLGMPVNAAVVHAGPVDLLEQERFRPGFEEHVFSELVPDFSSHREEFYRSRSAIRWAEELTKPILLVQGTADWRVDPRESLRMAMRLQELGRPYSLVMYEGDDHGIGKHRDDLDRRILDWFAAHRR